ncbi:MAG TPA: hypothetical protein VF624_08905 [Tepidisphaeraceae bacterium]|jgi:hypothetical protein
MRTTYTAILDGEKITWVGEDPKLAKPTRVEIELEAGPAQSNGPEVARLFEQLSKSDPFADIKDPVAWQREQRKDRPLPGRE